MLKLDSFTQQQASIITAPIKENLHVIAGAGTGKTQTIAGRICYVCGLTGEPERVWALSFTNAASRELSQRIDALAGHTLNVQSSTIHGMAYRLLKRISQQFAGCWHVPDNLTVLTPTQSKALIANIRIEKLNDQRDENNSSTAPTANDISKIIGYIKSRNGRLADKDLESRFGVDDFSIDCWVEYETYCVENDLFDFNDLVGRLNLIFESNSTITEWAQSQLDYMFIDEFQDVSLDQSLLIDTLTKHAKTCVVGDDAQAIYGWRGADVEQFVSYASREDVTCKHLTFNFRSHAGILAVSNLIRTHKLQSIAPNMQTVNSYTSPRRIQFNNDKENFELVANQVEALIKSKAYKASEIGILYRTNSAAQPMQSELTKRGIKSLVHGSGDFWKNDATQRILSALELCEAPNNLAAFSVYVSGFSGVNKSSIAELRKSGAKNLFDELTRYSPSISASLCFNIDAISVALDTSLEAALSHIEQNPESIQSKHPDQVQESAATLRGLVELKGLSEPNEIKEWASFAKDSEENGSPSHVNLMTIHGSKGKQFKVVIVLDMSNGVLPRRGGCGNSYKADGRLMYVALTRASDILYITHKKGDISDFLKSFEPAFEDWSNSVIDGGFGESFMQAIREHRVLSLDFPSKRNDWVALSRSA